MKNTMTCALFFRRAFALSTVRMRIIDAPVVPTNDAITVPTASRTTFSAGDPLSFPLRWMPPVTVNSAQRRMMNGMYSWM